MTTAMTPQQIVTAFAAEGVPMRASAGWETRGTGLLTPIGVGNHHTASMSRTDFPSEGICVNGRSDLGPPLCNFLIGRSGTCLLVAARRANHFGSGHKQVFDAVAAGVPTPNVNGKDSQSGNTYFYGIEIENDGRGEPYPPIVLDTVCRVNAAICKFYGWNQYHCIHHKNWTDRKIDMSYTGDLQASIALRILGGKPDPMLPTYDPTHPSLVVYKDSPEEHFVKAYLSGALKVHEQQPLAAFQIISIPRDHSWLPSPIPPHTIGLGTAVPGWAQIAGKDRFETLRLMVDFLGIDAEQD